MKPSDKIRVVAPHHATSLDYKSVDIALENDWRP
jgi:hypothetical protein